MTEDKKTIKVLVIDDHPFFATNLKYKLASHNYEVIAAKNGYEGIIKAKETHND